MKIFRKSNQLKSPWLKYFSLFILAFALVVYKGSELHSDSGGFLSLLRNTYAFESYELTALDTSSMSQLGTISLADGQIPANLTTLAIIDDGSLFSSNFTLTDAMNGVSTGSDIDKIQKYIVKEGDTLSFISTRYGISTQTIVQTNGLRSADAIKPEMELTILPKDGLLVKVASGDTVSALANKYSSSAESIIASNDLGPTGDLSIGEDLFIPDGKVPIARNAKIRNATSLSSLPSIDGYYITPLKGVKTQGLHGGNAVDIGAPCGTSVYAAAGGTVIQAESQGWNSGYGKVVAIQHPNGTYTRYAHASAIFVAVGQTVAQGEEIMLVGTTGKSTGCHTHLEMHGAKNPWR